MNARRLASLVREFGFLKQIPGLDRVEKIEVARCDPSILLETGVIKRSGNQEVSKIFHVVCGEKVRQLEFSVFEPEVPVSKWGNGWRESTIAEPVGDQIHRFELAPDFIVCCDNHGGSLEVLTIYKMDNFDLEAWCFNRRQELEIGELEYNSEDVPFTESWDPWGY